MLIKTNRVERRERKQCAPNTFHEVMWKYAVGISKHPLQIVIC